MRHVFTAAMVSTLLAGATTASAQLSDFLTNTSFDLNWQDASPARPANALPGGVFGMSNNGDIGAAAVTTVSRTGPRSISIGPLTPGDFTGYTTDARENFGPRFSFKFFDVPISWDLGDIQFSIWYMVPADQSLGTAPTPNWPVDAPLPFVWPAGLGPAGVKLEAKGSGDPNQTNGSLDPWSFGFSRSPRARDLLIWGTTNGEWRQLSFTWPARAADGSGWKDQTEFNATPRPNDNPPYPGYPLPPAGTTPNPPAGQPRFPDRLKITIGRWNPSTVAAGGTIYFDDVTFTQLPIDNGGGGDPEPCNDADLGKAGGLPGPDEMLDNNDFIAFINFFFDHDAHADMGVAGGFRGSDGQWDNNDFIAFITVFFEGCD